MLKSLLKAHGRCRNGYKTVQPKFCNPKQGQACMDIYAIWPDGPTSTKGTLGVNKDDVVNFKSCVGIFDTFGRKIASCSKEEKNIFKFESLPLPNKSIWLPSQARGDYVLYETK